MVVTQGSKNLTGYREPPRIKVGKNILIVAHGNSLRALMMYLEHISEKEIADVNLATGMPRLYEFDSYSLKSVFYIQ